MSTMYAFLVLSLREYRHESDQKVGDLWMNRENLWNLEVMHIVYEEHMSC
jgi:hypothetical protein